MFFQPFKKQCNLQVKTKQILQKVMAMNSDIVIFHQNYV